MPVKLDKYGQKALDLVMQGQSFFITGKAGTGKTTVLREITAQCKREKKNIVVLAPTGVAAKHANGMTIHSFLHLPLSPYIPGIRIRKLYALKEDEVKLINQIDLIVIDEVSMVRCDLLDAVDDVLRHYRKSGLPFGGIQVVMFGDLFQLMPVAPEDDWQQLKETYASPYFFSSKVLEKMDCPLFELKMVHRQDDRNFVTLLNNVRLGSISSSELKELAGRYKKNFIPRDDEGYIRLTTHNWRSKSYNQRRLEELPGDSYKYKAYIDDFFPKEEWPTSYYLELKCGARVMFIRNDPAGRYINGTLGTVTSLGEGSIIVETDEGGVIDVERQSWDFYRYEINKRTKEIEPILCGSFRQYPLKLAWAVTIHKSQGLTFDKVVIDAGRAFTYGQVYVALSRCRKFHGIVLVSPITAKIIKTDPLVTAYMKSVKKMTLMGEESEDEVRHLGAIQGAGRTLWMLRDGLSPQQIAEESRERIEIVYGHLTRLIENGEVAVADIIDEDLRDAIEEAIREVGLEAHLKEIKALCPKQTKYADIRMVLADIKYNGREGEFEKEEDESDDKSEHSSGGKDEWYFVDNIPFTKSSKYFLSKECRVVLSECGYYLEVNNQYIKLGDVPAFMPTDSGNLWVKKPTSWRGYELVHDAGSACYTIGQISEKGDRLYFMTPERMIYSIHFTEETS